MLVHNRDESVEIMDARWSSLIVMMSRQDATGERWQVPTGAALVETRMQSR